MATKKTMMTKGGSGVKKSGVTVDKQSVLNLGYGPISPSTLNKKVASGEVKETNNNGKLTYSKATAKDDRNAKIKKAALKVGGKVLKEATKAALGVTPITAARKATKATAKATVNAAKTAYNAGKKTAAAIKGANTSGKRLVKKTPIPKGGATSKTASGSTNKTTAKKLY